MPEDERITFTDQSGRFRWFDTPQATGHWTCDRTGAGIPRDLWRLQNGRWVLAPIMDGWWGLADAPATSMLSDEEALRWLLANGYDPPQDLKALALAMNAATPAVP